MIKNQAQLGLAGEKLVYMATGEKSTDEELVLHAPSSSFISYKPEYPCIAARAAASWSAGHIRARKHHPTTKHTRTSERGAQRCIREPRECR